MIEHSETKILNYTDEQMFKLVADIENYPHFIPWCEAVRIRSRYNDPEEKVDILTADMVVSFKVLRETLTCQVKLDPKLYIINVEYLSGPFNFLNNKWVFTQHENGCSVTFDVKFEFKSKIIQRLVGLIFHEAMKKIVKAFERRALELYKTG